VVSYEEYNQLQDTIGNVFDETLHNLQAAVQSSRVVQKKNGLLKHKLLKELQPVVQ
jgi:hypothetical protein